MNEGRSRRQTKPPRKYADDEDGMGNRQQKFVFRLLKLSEVTRDLLNEEVFLLWPEDNKWYPAVVKKVDVRRKRADLFYTTTDEEENVDLVELIDQKELAFKESRPLSHSLKPDEVLDNSPAAPPPQRSPTPKAVTAKASKAKTPAKPSRRLSRRKAGDDSELSEEEEDEEDNDEEDEDQEDAEGVSDKVEEDEDEEVIEDEVSEEDEKLEEEIEEKIKEDEKMEEADQADEDAKMEDEPHNDDKAVEQEAAYVKSEEKPPTKPSSSNKATSSHQPARPASSNEPTSSVKRRREQAVSSPDEVQGRPKRQITLSEKARDLLNENNAAQLHAILQGRDMADARRLETAAIQVAENPVLLRQEQDRFQSAEAYEQRLLSQIAAGARQRTDSFPTQRSGQKVGRVSQTQFYGKPAQTVNPGNQDREVRSKAEEQLTAALEKVAQEREDQQLPDAGEVAKTVELALFNLHGNAGKEYKAKYRSLIFNLRDAANPDLRANVLTGKIVPDKLVQMSAADLASKELAEWREEKEREAMKNAVLDDVVASKFSTAAAIANKRSERGGVDWRDNTLATASPPREAPKGPDEVVTDLAQPEEENLNPQGPDLISHSSRPSQTTPSHQTTAVTSLAGGLSKSDSVRSPAMPLDESAAGLKTSETMPSKTSTTFDWASIKATQELNQEAAQQNIGSNVDDDNGSEEYNPESDNSEGPTVAPSSNVELAAQLSIATSVELSERLWNGLLVNACPVPLPVSIDYLAGNPSQCIALPHRQVEVKGRVELGKVQEFMKGLKTSRSRTISLASVRLSSAASSDEKAQFQELIAQYTAKQRCSVFPQKDIEYYLMPGTDLAQALMVSAGNRRLPDGNLLLACVHPKHLKALPSRDSSSSQRISEAKAAANGSGKLTPAHPPITSPAQAPAAQRPDPAPASSPAYEPQAAEPHPGASTTPAGGGAGPPASELPVASGAAADAANVLAEALSTQSYDQTVSDPRLASGGAKSKEDIAKELMLPQGIDLSSLSSLAAALGVTHGLQALATHQQGSEAAVTDNRSISDPRIAPSQNALTSSAMSHQQNQAGFPPGPPLMQNPNGGQFTGPLQGGPVYQEAQQPLPGPPGPHPGLAEPAGVLQWGLPPQQAGAPMQLPGPPGQLTQQGFHNPAMPMQPAPNLEPRPQMGHGPHSGFQHQPPPQFMQQPGFPPQNVPGPQQHPGMMHPHQPNQMHNPNQGPNPGQMDFRPPGGQTGRGRGRGGGRGHAANSNRPGFHMAGRPPPGGSDPRPNGGQFSPRLWKRGWEPRG